MAMIAGTIRSQMRMIVRPYEDNFRALRSAAPEVAMLPSNSDWFLPQLAVGADGLLSGLASLTPAWLCELWTAAEAMDLAAMPLERAVDAGDLAAVNRTPRERLIGNPG